MLRLLTMLCESSEIDVTAELLRTWNIRQERARKLSLSSQR